MGIISKLLGIDELKNRASGIERSIGSIWEWINYLNFKLSEIDKKINELDNRIKEIESIAKEEFDREEIERAAKIEDKFIFQVLHNLAAFSEDTAIDTIKIYRNIPFLITPRGLRKKLEQLERDGLLRSFKKGNKRFWYIKEGRISEVQEVLAKEEEGEKGEEEKEE